MNAIQDVHLNEVCGYLLNTLNEVLHGFSVDFRSSLATDRPAVLEVFQKLDDACRSEDRALLSNALNRTEADLLAKCSQLCRTEFDPDEFETRLGSSIAQAILIENALKGCF